MGGSIRNFSVSGREVNEMDFCGRRASLDLDGGLGVYATNCVYEAVTGWDAFEPALTKAEEMGADVIWNCAAEIPEEWYEGDRDGLHRLAESLSSRRHLIRRLITIFRESVRKRFPNWRDSWPKVGGRTAHSNVLHPE
jgi:hypothetical protein